MTKLRFGWFSFGEKSVFMKPTGGRSVIKLRGKCDTLYDPDFCLRFAVNSAQDIFDLDHKQPRRVTAGGRG